MSAKSTRLALAAVGGAIAYAKLVRPGLLRWGAMDQEVEGPYPGSDLIPSGERGATMAITIDAPPSDVWPWLVQIRCNCAGYYSWDRLDNAGVPSARAINPEWQRTAVGDRLDSLPSGAAWFEVVALEREVFLGLRAPLGVTGRPFDTGGVRPRIYSDSLWGFWLKELASGRTRLIVSGYAANRPRLTYALGELLFWEPVHWIMQTRQLANLTRRAEGSGAAL